MVHWGAWALLRCYDPVLARGGLVPHRWGCTMYQGSGVGTGSPTWITHITGSKTWTVVYFPRPIDVTAGWAASLVNTRYYPFVYWSNVSKVFCLRKQQKHQSGHTQYSDHFAMLAHTQTHTHTNAHTHTHTHTNTHMHMCIQKPLT